MCNCLVGAKLSKRGESFYKVLVCNFRFTCMVRGSFALDYYMLTNIQVMLM